MRFIRTKDGIIDIDNFINKKENYSIRSIKGTDEEKARFVYFMKCGITQADTIEELCDEFVFIDEFFKREHRHSYSLENALALCKYHDVDITTLRGAIWTDKGLIYVAKMNEDGVLCLIQ